MNPGRRRTQALAQALWFLALWMTTLTLAQGPATPRIGYVYPAGGQLGSSFQVAVGGQYLDGVTNVYVSGSGVRAEVRSFIKPMLPGQFNSLRDKFKELQERKRAASGGDRRRHAPEASAAATNAWTAADERTLAELREKLLRNPPNRNLAPALAEVATLDVAIDPGAEPGERELRLGTPNGLSNPLIFLLSELPEISAPPATSPNPERERFQERFGRATVQSPTNPVVRVRPPALVNGQIMPGEIDRFRFSARKGERLVVAVKARALIPYLPDAVPGWFQATLRLLDAQGHELQFVDDYRFHPDPVLFHEIPAAGDYTIEIKDALYRGREDFVYRIELGELPYVTSVFPLGGRVGATSTVELRGWNLPRQELAAAASHPGLMFLDVGGRGGSKVVPFAVGDLPEGREREPNEPPSVAQAVACPAIVNGRIDRPGDVDVFQFEGRAGDRIVAEVQARRLGSPLDSALQLVDPRGQLVAANDDSEDKGAGLTTHHADSYLVAALPANGAYRLRLVDAQGKGGAEYGYRLRVGPPRPDFAIRLVPASINVRGGGTVPIEVHALRQDGFTNEIALALKDAPGGFQLSGARVPSGCDRLRLTLTAPRQIGPEPVALRVEGRAVAQGRELVRLATPAEDLTQAFAYRHLVPAKELLVCVSGRSPQRAALSVVGDTPVKLPVGGAARVRLRGLPRVAAESFELDLSEPPPGIALASVEPTRGGLELEFRCTEDKPRSIQAGNLIVQAFTAGPDAAAKGKPQRNRRVLLGTLPAIPFEVVGP